MVIICSVDDYKSMKPRGSKPSVMFGLCKDYKGTTTDNKVPTFHSILSAVGTCN